MKKTILSFVVMATMLFGLQAQTEITTYDASDANLNGEVNVGDAEYVANQVLTKSPGQNVVTAEQLNDVLQNVLQELSNIKQRLNYVMEKTEIGNPFEPDENGILANGHAYVDLGVVVDGKPVYWATTNIGAELPADYGLYFAWGETVGYTEDTTDGRMFDWASYSSDLCGGAENKMKKYCTYSDFGNVDNKTFLDPEDDAAHMNWHGNWRMPTDEELNALCTQCTWTWTTMTNSAGKSIKGYKVSNNTDSSKSIFLPAAGFREDDYLDGAELFGNYWSISLSTDYRDCYRACQLMFSSGYKSGKHSNYRYCGQPIRPVCQ